MTDIESILRTIIRDELQPIRAALAELARNEPVVIQAPPVASPTAPAPSRARARRIATAGEVVDQIGVGEGTAASMKTPQQRFAERNTRAFNEAHKLRVDEHARAAYCPSGPPIEELKRKIIEYRIREGIRIW